MNILTCLAKQTCAAAAALTIVSLTPAHAKTPQKVPDEKLSWHAMVDRAFAASAKQHKGVADSSRACIPEQKACVTTVRFFGKDGALMFLQTISDLNDRVGVRQVCRSNPTNDIHYCVNYDTGEQETFMLGTNGSWKLIEGAE